MNSTLQSAHQLMSSLSLRSINVDSQRSSHFNKAKLPPPESFWARHGVVLSSKKGWIMAKCIFHDDRHASLSIRCDTGGFFCHACGAKGGDVLTAHRLIAGCDFVTAAKALGAWEEQ